MDELIEAIVLEAGFTSFWKGSSPRAAKQIFAWDGILATLYRKTFVTNAPIARAVLQILAEAA